MTNSTRTIKASNLTPGCWYNSLEIVPPDNRKILCCDQKSNLWFDFFDTNTQTWGRSNTVSCVFYWQEVSTPLSIMFD